MDFKLVIGGVGLMLMAGCGSVMNGTEVETSNEQNDIFTLTIQVSEYKPHCGGAAPTPEMEANMTQHGSGKLYFLYEGVRPEKKSDFTRVVANSEGIIKLELAAGTYSMITEDKLLSFEEFLGLKKVEGVNYINQPDSCYEEWRNSDDFSIVLSSDTSTRISINHRCFTGLNPCLQYTGPYPP